MRSKSVLLLVSAVLGVVYAVYIVSYLIGANSADMTSAEAIGAGIGTMLLIPHALCACLAALFNVIGWSMGKRGFALAGGILYAVAILCMPLYALFTIVQCVLSFVGYARMRKPID